MTLRPDEDAVHPELVRARRLARICRARQAWQACAPVLHDEPHNAQAIALVTMIDVQLRQTTPDQAKTIHGELVAHHPGEVNL